jgi:predicted CoA-substrate-specific enzyme activase
MNDKCAAGTGRFLEVIAAALGLKMEDLGKLSLKSTSRVIISNTCTIFARQEVVARLSEGVKLENIVAGLHYAIASRVATMVRKLRPEPDIVFTGGVAKNIGVVKAMEENMGQKVFVPEEPLLSGALGAAMLGWELFSKAVAEGKPIQKKKRHLEEVTFYA